MLLLGVASAADWAETLRQRRDWWSLKPLSKYEIPAPATTKSDNPIDRFISDKLAAAGLHQAAPTDRTTLARRLCYILTGLPPAPDDVARFENDADPAAVRHYIDSLLASPHFGEHWARHWMDVVRYGDTYGYEWDIPARGAWRYRDYLIRAFNDDLPYDQFVREQIAGDLLPTPRINPKEQINESLVATMFFQLGENRHGDSSMFNGIHQEMLNNKIEAFSKAFQATTVACAKCHDHKLDAVSQRDYHALAGVFMSSRWVTNTLDLPTRNAQTIQRLREIKTRMRAEVGKWWRETFSLDALQLSGDMADGKSDRPIEDPLHSWQLISRVQRQKLDIQKTWTALGLEYAKQGADRSAANKKTFKPFADFSHGLPPGWTVDGVGLRDGPVRSGDFTVALTGAAAIVRILPAGIFSDSLSPRLNGALRSPLLELDQMSLSALAAGGDFSAERFVVDNAFISERQAYLKSDQPDWRTLAGSAKYKGRRIFIEYATKTSNPNFPPRFGLGAALTPEMIADPKSWFGVTQVMSQAIGAAGKPADELTRFASLFTDLPPKSLEDVKAKYRHWLLSAVDAWTEDKSSDDQVKLLNWMLKEKWLPNEGKLPDSVARCVAEYRQAESQLLEPQTANGMIETDPPVDFGLQIRGDYDRVGDPIPRGYLEVFRLPSISASSSGRRELADFVASPADPLTARVYVNRIWHWMFGAGLVATPDDFGHLGQRPSHPELLDYLSRWFIDNGWSTKKLIRLLAASQTFAQSSADEANATNVDPQNRLLHHFSPKRLEAESVRDAMLVASGRLDAKLFGPAIAPFRVHEDAPKRLFTGPMDGNGRRSIYIEISIMEPPAFLATFNQPPPKISTGKRDVTNVPAQSLALLNDPFVLGQAEFWGKRLAALPSKSVADRIAEMFRVALGRNPTAAEASRWAELASDLARDHGVSGDAILAEPAVWKDLAHTLFNTKEFIYVR